jgi:hypothetical protein
MLELNMGLGTALKLSEPVKDVTGFVMGWEENDEKKGPECGLSNWFLVYRMS